MFITRHVQSVNDRFIKAINNYTYLEITLYRVFYWDSHSLNSTSVLIYSLHPLTYN